MAVKKFSKLKEEPGWVETIRKELIDEYNYLKDSSKLRHEVLNLIYRKELEVVIAEYYVNGDIIKYKEGLLRALQAAKQMYEMFYTEKKDIIENIDVVNMYLLPFAINSFNRKTSLYFAENFNKNDEFTKTLKKNRLFRIGLLYKYAILEDKANLNLNIEECFSYVNSNKDFKDFEGYVMLFKLFAKGEKNENAFRESLEVSKINFKKNSRANSAKIFGAPPFSYYDQFAIAILNLFNSKGIEVDVTGFDKLPKELIRGFDGYL